MSVELNSRWRHVGALGSLSGSFAATVALVVVSGLENLDFVVAGSVYQPMLVVDPAGMLLAPRRRPSPAARQPIW